jgi:hypothetical protein
MVRGTGLEPASCEAADFRHTASFDASHRRSARKGPRCQGPRAEFRDCSCAGLCLRHNVDVAWKRSTSRIRRPPSSLYTFPPGALRVRRAWLGVASGRADAHPRGFAEFEGFYSSRFRPGTQIFKSAMFTNFITPARADAILPPARAPLQNLAASPTAPGRLPTESMRRNPSIRQQALRAGCRIPMRRGTRNAQKR